MTLVTRQSIFADDATIAGDLERQKLDALAEFAAGAGHEINNPLAIIMGLAQTLLTRTDDESLRRPLGQICAQVRRAHEMIADIRLFARPPQPEWSEVSLVEFLQTVIAAWSGVEFVIAPSWTPPATITSDAVALRVALDALLKNAHESLAGKVRLTLAPALEKSDAVLVSVDDSGAGIPPEIRSLIFDPYFSGRQAGRGLGFGLCKAWKIAQQLGGELSVTSSDLGGARFVLKIPLTAS